jgi:hypothetical protein
MRDPISDTSHLGQSFRLIYYLSRNMRIKYKLVSIRHQWPYPFQHLSAERLLNRDKPSREILPARNLSKDLAVPAWEKHKSELWKYKSEPTKETKHRLPLYTWIPSLTLIRAEQCLNSPSVVLGTLRTRTRSNLSELRLRHVSFLLFEASCQSSISHKFKSDSAIQSYRRQSVALIPWSITLK